MRFSPSLTLSVVTLFYAALVVGTNTQGVTNFSPSDPQITFCNTASSDRSYTVEGNADNPDTAYGAGTSPLDPVVVPAGSTINFNPGVGFIGAISDLDGSGTRHEVNFRDSATTWYNADMQFGMSNSTLGTTDGSKRIDGGDSLTGEQDCLGKANSAWADVDQGTKSTLMSTNFLEGSMGGLTAVSMGQEASAAVITFFQMTAEFNAYVDAGSVEGVSTSAVAAAADKMSLSVATNKLTITAYD